MENLMPSRNLGSNHVRSSSPLAKIVLVGAVLIATLVLSGHTTPSASAADLAWPVIFRVEADGSQLTIEGVHLSSGGAPPRVFLGRDELTVLSHAPALVVADLPPGLAPGDYLLRVADRLRIAAFIVSLRDPNRLVTSGGIVIESTGASVRIAAAGSVITLDSAGNITLQSAGNLSLVAGGALSLTGSSVNLRSDQSMNVAAGVDFAVNAGRNFNAQAGSGMTLDFGSVLATTGNRAVTSLGGNWSVLANGVDLRSQSDIDIAATGEVRIRGTRVTTN